MGWGRRLSSSGGIGGAVDEGSLVGGVAGIDAKLDGAGVAQGCVEIEVVGDAGSPAGEVVAGIERQRACGIHHACGAVVIDRVAGQEDASQHIHHTLFGGFGDGESAVACGDLNCGRKGAVGKPCAVVLHAVGDNLQVIGADEGIADIGLGGGGLW